MWNGSKSVGMNLENFYKMVFSFVDRSQNDDFMQRSVGSVVFGFYRGVL
ncbi:hypothetical protein LEP1GSC120_1336 [Leptospira santarosai str. 200702252]|uniref:Uncharacterized protein n=3 Tax=Leptospira santarosai TaxID=28183 RepID=K8Y1U5_9LEPT|nr:hypothetical protein LEP1GSC179_0830 [Leptospira santarosai str. MOR084]EKS10065.1 hypothetical protein LEP1GSC071_3398 [Leptospira santarosai str. JET]EKT87474.1 hypothetical protein LSS_07679 [Leptospira santarosai serovar Shermani str. LT 821]EMI60712.1 hypothetical protein LEP1GSC076_2679 [Leptospira sp. Fiocruz LV4135]EMM77849.1 hypothetical protein LEP1GSC040_0760 [Leptospira santarosai str. 2000030832]EMM87291.1 hypothetical protein LEP1GSC039_0986 [Leptospira santarosai str. 2000027